MRAQLEKRDISFDLIRIIGILLVVAGLLTAIAFHLALGPKKSLLHTAWNTLSGLSSARAPDGIYWNTPLWFLPALFWGLIALGFLHAIAGKRFAIPVAMILGCIAIIPASHFREILPFGWDTATAALFFLAVGKGLQQTNLLGSQKVGRWALIGTAAAAIWVLLRFLDHNAYYVVAHLKVFPLWSFLPTGIAGSLSLICWVKVGLAWLEHRSAVGTRGEAFLARAAFFSFPIYLIHKPIVLAILHLSESWNWDPNAIFLLAFAVGTVVSYAIIQVFVLLAPQSAGVVLGGRALTKRS
jgi:fucose 4-O-acetylase-like acetyltransferase